MEDDSEGLHQVEEMVQATIDLNNMWSQRRESVAIDSSS